MLYNAYSQKLSGHTKSRKDPVSYLNIMVVGAVGTGKTTFLRTFYETLKHDVIQGSLKESKPTVLKDALCPTEELYTVSMHIEEEGQRTALTFIDTPGFTTGFAIDHQLRYIAKYIDYQFERTLAEESKVKRDAKALDTHIHSCLYFIDTRSMNGLSDADRYILKMLSTRVNVIPVIGKSDTMTVSQCEQLKSVFKKEIFDILQIPVYGFIEVDDMEQVVKSQSNQQVENNRSPPVNLTKILDMLQECVEEDKDEDARVMIDYLHTMPFTLIGYEEDPTTGRPIDIADNEIVTNKSTATLDSQGMMDTEEEAISSPVSFRDAKNTKRDAATNGVLGRRYPWAVVECCNPRHCDFLNLKHILLSQHRDMLRIDTFERFYEQYRTEQLLNRKVNRTMRLGSKEGVALK